MTMRVLLAAWLMAGTALACTVPAQPPPAARSAYAQIDCKEYSDFARRVAMLRAFEAKLELVIQQTRIDAGAEYGAKAQALVREVQHVYAERKSPADAQFEAWKRCTAVLGRFGPEV